MGNRLVFLRNKNGSVQISPPPTSPYYWEEQAKNLIEYDPDRANKLIDEMGLTDRDAEG